MTTRHMIAVAFAVASFGSAAQAVNIDFATEDDFVTALANRQIIDTEFGNIFNVSSSGDNAGLGIFDTDPNGPNLAPGLDPDLLVDLGLVMILQENNNGYGSNDGSFFDVANDDASHNGIICFDFLEPVFLNSIDLIDINGNGPVTVTLTDSGGDTRTYVAPMNWTFDISVDGPKGWDTLDLTSLLDQPGEGGGVATGSQTAGFSDDDVVKLTIEFDASGAIDNLNFVPEPTSGAFLGLALIGLLRRRRRQV